MSQPASSVRDPRLVGQTRCGSTDEAHFSIRRLPPPSPPLPVRNRREQAAKAESRLPGCLGVSGAGLALDLRWTCNDSRFFRGFVHVLERVQSLDPGHFSIRIKPKGVHPGKRRIMSNKDLGPSRLAGTHQPVFQELQGR